MPVCVKLISRPTRWLEASDVNLQEFLDRFISMTARLLTSVSNRCPTSIRLFRHCTCRRNEISRTSCLEVRPCS
jgi:hypothetical protein